ncbi:hypothetical protein ACFSM5_22130 [Lacibacterium aquatile]|uniref:Uncharacterized protein n=1 Tax=Lacibacterium aquatile TaxID=1168082 RepID=A0ABW5DYU3_9PROT
MTRFNATQFLRRVLILDAVASGATGLLLLLGAGFLTPWLGLDVPLMQVSGAILVPYAAAVAYLATREQLNRKAVLAVAIINALWVVDSIVLLVGGWAEPTLLGILFVATQAAVVGIFAELQIIGLKRAKMAAA